MSHRHTYYKLYITYAVYAAHERHHLGMPLHACSPACLARLCLCASAAAAMLYPSAQNALNIIIARQTETVQRHVVQTIAPQQRHVAIPWPNPSAHCAHCQPATHASSGVHIVNNSSSSNTNINGVALYTLACSHVKTVPYYGINKLSHFVFRMVTRWVCQGHLIYFHGICCRDKNLGFGTEKFYEMWHSECLLQRKTKHNLTQQWLID